MAENDVPRLPNTVKGSTRLRHDTGWVYLVGNAVGEPVKIGYSYNLSQRLIELQGAHWRELLVHAAFEAVDYRTAEGRLHHRFDQHLIRGEWFEWSDDLAGFIAKLESGCGKTLRHLEGTGHVRIGQRYHNFTARLQENERKKRLREGKRPNSLPY